MSLQDMAVVTMAMLSSLPVDNYHPNVSAGAVMPSSCHQQLSMWPKARISISDCLAVVCDVVDNLASLLSSLCVDCSFQGQGNHRSSILQCYGAVKKAIPVPIKKGANSLIFLLTAD